VLLGQWLAEPGFRAEYRRVNQLEKKRRPRDIVREQTDTSYLKTDYARLREPVWPAFYRNCVYKPLLRLGAL